MVLAATSACTQPSPLSHAAPVRTRPPQAPVSWHTLASRDWKWRGVLWGTRACRLVWKQLKNSPLEALRNTRGGRSLPRGQESPRTHQTHRRKRGIVIVFVNRPPFIAQAGETDGVWVIGKQPVIIQAYLDVFLPSLFLCMRLSSWYQTICTVLKRLLTH